MKLNRLKDERSPYLRQHQTNPVDWYPWGPEALKRAQDEDRPIFLSVGYAACHWCHVMEHESFEDEATAELLNATFVCVKVDREERPDVDRIYMNAVQLFGRGGWPMTVLMTPDGRPFWGGTYLQKEQLQGLTKEIGRVWKTEREKVLAQAEAVTERVRLLSDGPDVPETSGSDADLIEHMRNALKAAFDARHGGWGTRPKFPPHTELLFFLDGGRADETELEHVTKTLEAMEEGGIHDHVGGGFHRYSTDERWLLPHFEKMLYDNALLMQAYAGMYARTKDARYKRVVTRIGDWLEREMRREGGGYASSLDADTEGEEGLTYTWTQAELVETLGDDAGFAAEAFGFEASGNFRDEATQQTTGRNIVYLPISVDVLAAKHEMKPDAMQARLDGLMERMLADRAKRAQPGLDDKVITAWNALLISGFVRAGVDCDLPEYLERAKALADVLLTTARREDGTLLRFPKASGPEIVGFCEDHAHLLSALLDLADATGEERWATEAEALGKRMVEMFADEQGGGFWATSTGSHETLIARAKEVWDSPIPSDNGVAARACLRLAARTKDESFEQAADRTLGAFRPLLGQPRMASMLMALYRAMVLRQQQEAAGTAHAAVGDVHLRQDVALVDLFAARDRTKPGSRVPILVRVALDEGWHAAGPGGEAVLPMELKLAEGAPAALENVRFPEASRIEDAQPRYGGTFEIGAELVVPADAPPGPRRVTLLLTIQVCSDKDGICKAPETITLDLPLRYAAEDGEPKHPTVFK
ncbi:MAG: DUF255 domain-containing protein [Planctomycetota bacterium]|nr:DUF255 domain-containing protein [Planctomycetota bacterium]